QWGVDPKHSHDFVPSSWLMLGEFYPTFFSGQRQKDEPWKSGLIAFLHCQGLHQVGYGIFEIPPLTGFRLKTAPVAALFFVLTGFFLPSNGEFVPVTPLPPKLADSFPNIAESVGRYLKTMRYTL